MNAGAEAEKLLGPEQLQLSRASCAEFKDLERRSEMRSSRSIEVASRNAQCGHAVQQKSNDSENELIAVDSQERLVEELSC
jgi:hypothetical protein